MKKDEELVRKGKATNAVKHLYGQGALAICAAIDALEPIPVAEDAVSRDKVFRAISDMPMHKVLLFEKGQATGQKILAVYLDRLKVFDVITEVPSLPVPGRSEEEIRGAIQRLDKTLAEKFTFEPKPGCSPQSNLPTRWHQTKHMYKYLREGLKAVVKETNLWDFLFQPPDKKGGTGGK